MIEPGGVAETDGVGGGEQPEKRIWADHTILVEQGQTALHLQDALNDEHHIWAARVIFIENQRNRTLQGPGQHAFAEFGDLTTVFQDDGVLAYEIDAADMAVKVDADQRPIEPRRHLFNMGGFSGAVIALHHDPAVIGKARTDGEGRLGIEPVGRVDIGHVGIAR